MNENLDLREILKNASEGLELWSYACGTCYFEQIVKYTDYPIVCRTIGKDGQIRSIEFTKEGKRDTIYSNGKCVLFPSEQNHDWSTFVVPKDHKEFKPFEKVLRANSKEWQNALYPWMNVWSCDFYNFYDKDTRTHYCVSGYSANDDEIIPYEGNENKLGKKFDIKD